LVVLIQESKAKEERRAAFKQLGSHVLRPVSGPVPGP
jgi:hypothetical protein